MFDDCDLNVCDSVFKVGYRTEMTRCEIAWYVSKLIVGKGVKIKGSCR